MPQAPPGAPCPPYPFIGRSGGRLASLRSATGAPPYSYVCWPAGPALRDQPLLVGRAASLAGACVSRHACRFPILQLSLRRGVRCLRQGPPALRVLPTSTPLSFLRRATPPPPVWSPVATPALHSIALIASALKLQTLRAPPAPAPQGSMHAPPALLQALLCLSVPRPRHKARLPTSLSRALAPISLSARTSTPAHLSSPPPPSET